MTAVPPEAVTAEAWAAAGQAARGYAPDLAEALAVHIAAGPDGRHIAEIVGAAVAKAARDAVEAAAPHIRAQVYAEILQLALDSVERSVKSGFDATAMIRFTADLIMGGETGG